MQRHRPRSLLSVVATVVGALALAGCGGGSTGASETSDTRAVKHAYGTSTIPAQPKRVVALSSSDAEILVSLGVTPVGVVGSGGFSETPMYPWINDRPEVADAAVIQPDQTGAIDVEDVAKLRPDVIFWVNNYIDAEKNYTEFSKIAPVVASTAEDVATETWQDQTRQIGAALDMSAKADSVIDDVQATIDDAAAANPGFKGASLSFVGVFAPDSVDVVFGKQDYTRKLLAELGFVVPPDQLKELPKLAEGGTQASVSLERLDLIDADALVISYADPKLRTQLEARPGYQRLTAVTSKKTVSTDITVAAALRVPSPLAVPYVLDQLVPRLSSVVG